jgi:hypothetical protein
MSFLNRANNFRGPIPKDVRGKLAAYFNNPAPKAADWEAIHSYVVVSTNEETITVWKAVRAIDPTFQDKVTSVVKEPVLRWHRVPDGFTVARAVKAAVKG